jgi:hypothetical protein
MTNETATHDGRTCRHCGRPSPGHDGRCAERQEAERLKQEVRELRRERARLEDRAREAERLEAEAARLERAIGRQLVRADGWVIDDARNMLTREQVAALDAQRAENDAARRRYLAGLEEQKAEERRREEERIDTLLAPRKDLERHRWLAAHPDRTPNDFERTWREHLRPVVVAELEDERTRQTVASLASSGLYTI